MSLFDKLQYKNEKNLLIQGLPSSIEKQFIKLNYAKSVTPLLRSRRIDFAIVFAVSQKQLSSILNEVVSALNEDARFWIAHPKPTAKIASDLCREPHWTAVDEHRLEALEMIEMDSVWCATRFKLNSVPHTTQNSVPRRAAETAEVAAEELAEETMIF